VTLPDPRALPAMDVAGRADRLREQLDGAGCDALVVSHLTNVRYLSGFTGTNGTLVVTPGGLTLLTDPRYDLRAADELAAAGVDASLLIARTSDEHRDALRRVLAGTSRVGLEADHVSWADQRRYAEHWLPDIELVPASGLVEELRAVKDPGEVARIEAAADIADDALAATRHLLEEPERELPTEAGFAAALDTEVRRLGAADVSFPTIVAAGPNGARPHHEPGARRVEPGDLVILDFGALVDGYHSDMTRTLVAGGLERLDDERARMLEVVTAAQAAGVAAVRAGRDASEVDAACREVIAEAGWADAFVHGTGHGVGLDIHEAPRVSTAPGATLLDGHVVTVEPGVYLPGLGGVRVEDTVVVTPTGCRALTRAPKIRIRPNA
jgi:Xaa-Pro aminopeptidase